MRVQFIVPSAEHMTTAGVRIRYERLMSHNDDKRLSVSVVPIQDMIKRGAVDSADVYVFSKVYAGLAEVMTRRLKEAGKVVGVDIFDDYFSQLGDVRLQHYRRWLERCGPTFDFLLCSTPKLKALLQQKFPDKPVLMIPDSAPSCDLQRVWMLANGKLERAIASRKLAILWFGIATNPYFPIGIQDLVAYGEELASLQANGWLPHLTILTNLDSLQTSHLAQLARLPITYDLAQWSAENEARFLDDAFLCFLPVNGQEFSQAKSLNRAISALSAGCQILSNGYPLYKELAGLIYSSTAELLRDLAAGEAKIGSRTIGAIGEIFVNHANSYAGYDDLYRFLQMQLASNAVELKGKPMLAPPPDDKSRRRFPIGFGILHGSGHDTRAHKAASAFGALSIKSPFTRANLHFDVRFDGGMGGAPIVIDVRGQAIELVAPEFRGSFEPHGQVGNAEVWRLSPEVARDEFKIAGDFPVEGPAPIAEICAYKDVMESVVLACNRLFPQLQIVVSELDRLRSH